MKESESKIVIAMSGGVDSSVAALMMKEKYGNALGVFLNFWKEEGGSYENKCCSTRSLFDARRICQKLGIGFYSLDFSTRFKEQVVDYFLEEYDCGHTPNPCIRCNKTVKIGYLLAQSQKLGFEKLATGHYAKVVEQGGKYKLYKAKDENKDQTYFLYTFTQADLARLEFPLGDYLKPDVRIMAKEHGLDTADKKESQEVCFVGDKKHSDFLKRYLHLVPGDIKSLDGKVIGHHEGLPLYTIGQRKGIEIGGTGPYYVIRMDFKTNDLFVDTDQNHPQLFAKEVMLENTNWIDQIPSGECEVVFRYRHKPVKCSIEVLPGQKARVTLKEPQRAVMPGQSMVFYRGDEVLGGGEIF